MPTRSRTTFQKRQKEMARMEKQREKAARRQRKEGGPPDAEALALYVQNHPEDPEGLFYPHGLHHPDEDEAGVVDVPSTEENQTT